MSRKKVAVPFYTFLNCRTTVCDIFLPSLPCSVIEGIQLTYENTIILYPFLSVRAWQRNTFFV